MYVINIAKYNKFTPKAGTRVSVHTRLLGYLYRILRAPTMEKMEWDLSTCCPLFQNQIRQDRLQSNPHTTRVLWRHCIQGHRWLESRRGKYVWMQSGASSGKRIPEGGDCLLPRHGAMFLSSFTLLCFISFFFLYFYHALLWYETAVGYQYASRFPGFYNYVIHII